MAAETYREHPGKTEGASRFIDFMGRKFFRLKYDIHYEWTESLPGDEPVLMLSKHSRMDDIPLGYGAMVHILQRHAWCVMKDNLTSPIFFDLFWNIGGIPLNRDKPEKSKYYLLYAREVLYKNNVMVLFPEQTYFPGTMGEGKVAGFRFISGKPEKPLAILPVGFVYKRRFPFRTKVTIRFGDVRYYDRSMDPAVFLHDTMVEIARLSDLEYTFPAPEGRRRPVNR